MRWLLLILLSSCWILKGVKMVAAQGLFRWVGLDYGLFRAQNLAFRSGGGAALYDLDALRRQLEPLVAYTTQPGQPLAVGPVPFPPAFAWMFTLFSLPPAPAGFALWTAVNLAAALHLARRAAQYFPTEQRFWVAGLVLTSFPVVYTLFVGQPILLLACAVAEAYVSLCSGHHFRAGLWVSCLLIKPQYGLLVGPLLIWKRQWLAVAGAIGGGVLIVGASVLAAGPSALLAYPAALGELSTFNGAGTLAYPEQMINWRGLILRLAPDVSDATGTLLAVLLGGLTIALTAYAWRGQWSHQSPKFASQMAMLMLATLMANYHSHPHGAALLVVPLCAVLAQPAAGKLVSAIAVAAFVCTTSFLAVNDIVITSSLLMAGMLALFGSLLWTMDRHPRGGGCREAVGGT